MGIFDFMKKKQKAPAFLYTEKELDEYEAYVEESLGHYDKVFHEIVSEDIHLDVIMIPPTEETPYYKLVTMGAGAYEMHLPENIKPYYTGRAEYVIFLPKDWNLDSDDECDYWPMRALKNTARLPVYADTWLGYGHTVQANAEGTPYADNTGFNSLMLVCAVDDEGEKMNLKMSSGKEIEFYLLLPLYPQELAYKKANDADALMDLFEDIPDFPVPDMNRKNMCE